MSTHFESMGATDTVVEVFGRGAEMGQEMVRRPLALTLQADSIVVVEGTKEELENLLAEALLKVRAFNPGHTHDLEIRDEVLECRMCFLRFHDLSSILSGWPLCAATMNGWRGAPAAAPKHIWEYLADGGSVNHWNCTVCGGENGQPNWTRCITDHPIH